MVTKMAGASLCFEISLQKYNECVKHFDDALRWLTLLYDN